MDDIPVRKVPGNGIWRSLMKKGNSKEAHGEILLDVTVDKQRASVASIDTGIAIDAQSGKKKSPTIAGLFGSKGSEKSPSEEKRTDRRSSQESQHLKRKDLSASAVSLETSVPEITGVSPNSGPELGGTRIIIRGQNLGYTRDDIESLTICGMDCLHLIESQSPSRIVCVTPSAVGRGSGEIVIQTRSGGLGRSTVQYAYLPSKLTK